MTLRPGLVPVLEIEWIPLDQDELPVCQRVTEELLSGVFETLRQHDVYLEGCVLKLVGQYYFFISRTNRSR